MGKRTVVVLHTIDANHKTCGRCEALVSFDSGAACANFNVSIDVSIDDDQCEPTRFFRAHECIEAERRVSRQKGGSK